LGLRSYASIRALREWVRADLNKARAARVTVEQQVTRNLTITYVSNVSSTQQQVIQVEYNVNRNVSIVALRDQNGTFASTLKSRSAFSRTH